MRRAALVVVALVLCATACSGDREPQGVPSSSTGVPATSSSSSNAEARQLCGSSAGRAVTHVIWIWMENHTADSVIGSPDAPFETDLAGQCASSTTYRAVGAPSLP